MFKIAYGAGHNADRPGNCIPKELDAAQTLEWTLNDRIARFFAQAASQYADVQLLRVDDPAGLEPVSLAKRCKAANQFGADFFLSIHHNAGVNLGVGGGLMAFSYQEGTNAAKYRDAIYDGCIAAGGIRGDRSQPKQAQSFYVLKNTAMPAVLMEYGFMDSKTDAPIILTEAFAKEMAYATMEAIAKVAGLSKKAAQTAQSTQTAALTLPWLRKGSTGKSVKALQQLLVGMGYSLPEHGIDGDFGAETELVVRTYQKTAGIGMDGVVGKTTWSALLGL